MFPMTITLHGASELNAVMQALGLLSPAPAPEAPQPAPVVALPIDYPSAVRIGTAFGVRKVEKHGKTWNDAVQGLIGRARPVTAEQMALVAAMEAAYAAAWAQTSAPQPAPEAPQPAPEAPQPAPEAPQPAPEAPQPAEEQASKVEEPPAPKAEPAPTPAEPVTSAVPTQPTATVVVVEAAAPAPTVSAPLPTAPSAALEPQVSTAAAEVTAALFTFDDVSAAIRKAVAQGRRDAVVAALGLFDATKGSELKPEQYREFLSTLNP